jgi:hypothetical protein
MSILTIPRSRFDWPAFAQAVRAFAVAHGLEEAFPVVHDDRVFFWQEHDDLLEDRDDLDSVPGPPLERLRAGLDIFAQFTMPGERGGVVCADGGVIESPNLDDETAPLLAGERRRLAEKTAFGECHAYGYLLSLNAGKLTVQTTLMTDSDGECHVECVVEPGLADKPMGAFIESFVKQRARNSSES